LKIIFLQNSSIQLIIQVYKMISENEFGTFGSENKLEYESTDEYYF